MLNPIFEEIFDKQFPVLKHNKEVAIMDKLNCGFEAMIKKLKEIESYEGSTLLTEDSRKSN